MDGQATADLKNPEFVKGVQSMMHKCIMVKIEGKQKTLIQQKKHKLNENREIYNFLGNRGNLYFLGNRGNMFSTNNKFREARILCDLFRTLAMSSNGFPVDFSALTLVLEVLKLFHKFLVSK